ncbi:MULTISPECIES: IS5 family transposase [Halorubrum]|uniref:Transposase (ISH1) n=1 Tax=Halorubrum hochstenium ATCC 700873 TaxID=1227481 RepID=M0F5L3_9EURY|nr:MULTISPECIES: IS5 family transposase [Halorubrum]ELZ54507.1 transposase (ISH1) [Halorubrum hochstenium ATCC 700873]
MGRLRNLAQAFHEFATTHVEEPDVPAVADGDDGYDKSTKIGLLLLKEEVNKPLRQFEDYLNEMPGILDVFDLEKSPDFTSFSVWDGEFPMQELRRLLRRSAEQAGLSGTASIDASGFQRDQASSHYRNRVGYSFNAMKTTLLVDTESLAIMDAHFTTKKAYDGHIGLQVFRRNAEDLQALLADKMYSWSDLREACREASTRPVIKHCEQNALKKAHNARIDDDVYNQRSMSETVFAMLKDDGDEIRSRSWHGQFRELTRKCIVHNLTQAAS